MPQVWKYSVAIGNLKRHMRKASHRGSKQQRSCVAISLRVRRTLVIMFNRSHITISRASTSQSLLLLLARRTYIMVLFFAHIPFVVNHTINATPPERLQQHPLLFTTNRTDRTFFVWKLNSARPSHPGHSTILLQLEISSGICAKLRTIAASNNRAHASQSLFAYASHHVQSFTHYYRDRKSVV